MIVVYLFVILSMVTYVYTLSERKWNLSLGSHVNEKLIALGMELKLCISFYMAQ